MAEKKELDAHLESDGQGNSLAKERIEELSTKVKLTAQERDELKELNVKVTSERDSANKEVEFYKGFTAVTAKYPNAGEHTDEIRTKVLAGYTVEDATVSVLNSAGKLIPAKVDKQTAAGGSATNIPTGGKKEIKDMSQAERREQLMEAQNRGDFGTD